MIKTYYNLNTQKFPSIFIRQFSSFEVRENSKVSHITRQYLEIEEKTKRINTHKILFRGWIERLTHTQNNGHFVKVDGLSVIKVIKREFRLNDRMWNL